MFPSFVIFIVYANFTTVCFIFFLFISTFGIISFSSPMFPVSIIVSFPSSVTIAFVTYFNSAKSKYSTLMFSISSSSSFGYPSPFPGIESLSSIGSPYSSLSSDICAKFVITYSVVSGSFTLNATFISL